MIYFTIFKDGFSRIILFSGSKCLLKNISILGVHADQFLWNMTEERQSVARKIKSLMQEGIRCGTVKPLDRTVFQHYEAEKAFRYMGSGNHVGKVLIKVCRLNYT